MLLVLAAKESVADACYRTSGHFEDYIDARRRDELSGVGRDGCFVCFDAFGDG
jgi:hypothetical protein